MAPDDRKRAIVEAALPLIREFGKDTTTKQIAEAAGIAEGTIFRVFASKQDLFEEAMAVAFDPELFIADLGTVDADLPLRERLVALTSLLQRRFVEIFGLMTALAIPKPPEKHRGEATKEWRDRGNALMLALLEPDRDAFRVPLPDVIHTLRLLTFSGSHPHITDQNLLTPDQIVDVVLYGTLTRSNT